MCNVEEVGLPGSGVSFASNHFTVEIVKLLEKRVRPRGTPGEIFFGSNKKGLYMGLGAPWHGADVPRRQSGRGGSLGTVLRAVWRTLIFATWQCICEC